MQEQSPWGLVCESFSLLKKNYSILFPYIITLALGIGALFLPFREMVIEMQQNPYAFPLAEFFTWLIAMVIVSIVLNFLVYGWVFAGVGSIVHNRELHLNEEFKAGVRMGWVCFLQMLIILLFALGAVLVGALVVIFIKYVYSISVPIGVALIALGVIVALIGLAWFVAYSLVVGAVLVVERIGPWVALIKAWRFFHEQFKYCITLFGIFILLVIASSIPQMLYSLSSGKIDPLSASRPEIITQSIASSVLSIPSLIVFTLFLIAYGVFYARNASSDQKNTASFEKQEVAVRKLPQKQKSRKKR
jgi:hypothetical protein